MSIPFPLASTHKTGVQGAKPLAGARGVLAVLPSFRWLCIHYGTRPGWSARCPRRTPFFQSGPQVRQQNDEWISVSHSRAQDFSKVGVQGRSLLPGSGVSPESSFFARRRRRRAGEGEGEETLRLATM